MTVRNFTLDNFKFPNTSDITKESGYYGFGTDIDGPLSYNEFTDNITMPITSQKAELIEESITIERIEYDLKLLVSNGVTINLPTQNVKTGRKVTVIPKFILHGEEIKEGKATVSAGQYSWKIYWDSFITFCWNGFFWYIDNNLSSYFYYPSPTKFLEKVLFGRIGKNWTQSNVSNISYVNFKSVAYGGDLWVAGSGSGSGNDTGLWYSSDGKFWTQSNIAEGDFASVAYGKGVYGNDLWIAGNGSNHGLYYSGDGKFWTQSNIKGGRIFSVAYANGKWVAGGSNGLYYSTNGRIWTQTISLGSSFYSAVYGDDLWVAGSLDGLYYSTDGEEWIYTTSGRFTSVAYANGKWVAGGDIGTGLQYSTDGQHWSQSNITDDNFKSVAYGDGMWVAGSDDNHGLYYSEDGEEWTQSNITSGYFKTVAYANGVWVAGSNGLYYSTDYGRNFIKVGGYMNLSVNKIIYGDFKVVCACNNYGILVSEID